MSGKAENMKLFWACFVALVATSFFFGLRGVVVSDMASTYELSKAEVGEILGVGLWPFAFSIIIVSLIIDRVGYKTIAIFSIVTHAVAVVGTVLSVKTRNAELLYWSTFLVAVGNGGVEGFINPVVATIFNREKTKWLNILHAGWPAGLALGAAAGILLGYSNMGLEWKFGICLVPVVFYALLTIPCTFPVQERVAAGVSYRDMLKPVGGLGFFVIVWLTGLGIFQVLNRFHEVPFSTSVLVSVILGVIAAVAAFAYTRSLGSPMFFLILLTMPFLATTELGTDGWMADLLAADLPKLAGWVFVGVSIVMTILRFYAGPIVHKFSPVGLLVVSAALAVVGLFLLGAVSGYTMLVAALVYAFGKTFLWSTTLGVVSEQFPKGGALTLNGVSGVGVLGMGILGTPLMGVFMDFGVDKDLKAEAPAALYEKVTKESRKTLFGEIPALDGKVVEGLPDDEDKTEIAFDAFKTANANREDPITEEEARKIFDRMDRDANGSLSEEELVGGIVNRNKKAAFNRQTMLPAFMLLCYLGLFFYFKSRGGYKPEELDHGEPAGGH